MGPIWFCPTCKFWYEWTIEDCPNCDFAVPTVGVVYDLNGNERDASKFTQKPRFTTRRAALECKKAGIMGEYEAAKEEMVDAERRLAEVDAELAKED